MRRLQNWTNPHDHPIGGRAVVLILNRSEVTALLDMAAVIEVVEQAHAALASGTAVIPEPPNVRVPGSTTLMIPMIAAIGPMRTAGVKLLTDTPGNVAGPVPRQQSSITLIDTETGTCEAFLEGAPITRFRTAAASAVATRHLARAAGGTLGFVGTGALARAHLEAIRCVWPVERVVAWSRRPQTVNDFAAEYADTDIAVEVMSTAEQVVLESDVLCTLTPSPEPVVFGRWFRAGLHVNAVGSPPRPDYRELDTEAIRRSRVVVDSVDVAGKEAGDLLVPVSEGAITADHFRDELGQVITGRVIGRRSPDDITLFKSVGLGIQDMATARLVVDLARARGVGREIPLH